MKNIRTFIQSGIFTAEEGADAILWMSASLTNIFPNNVSHTLETFYVYLSACVEKGSLTDRPPLNAEIETHLIPLRCIILMIMVALMKNNMKKSTISAKNLWTGEGMLYSRPRVKNRGEKNKQSVSQQAQIIMRPNTPRLHSYLIGGHINSKPLAFMLL